MICLFTRGLDDFTLLFGRAAELESEISEVKDTDEATALRRLGTMLRAVRHDYKVAKGLVDGTVEAAAKCQVMAVVRVEAGVGGLNLCWCVVVQGGGAILGHIFTVGSLEVLVFENGELGVFFVLWLCFVSMSS